MTKNKQNGLRMALWLALALLLPMANALEISQLLHSDPIIAGSTQTISVTFVSSSAVNSALVQIDGSNRTLQVQSSSYVYSWPVNSPGLHSYTIFARNNANETLQATAEFMATDGNAPSIIETSPSGSLAHSLVEVRAITDEQTTCRYDLVNISYDSMRYEIPGTDELHTLLTNFADGDHELFVKCVDPGRNSASAVIRFSVDASAPYINSISPTGNSPVKDITLQLSTSEQASCRWSPELKPYGEMSGTFDVTGGTVHTEPISLSSGQNIFYLSCMDSTGNVQEPQTHTITFNEAPFASVDLVSSDEEILPAGTHEVKLTISEPLSQVPTLRLGCGGRGIGIPLEGSGVSWKGFLIVPEDIGECAGEFTFEGIDMQGTVGKTISSGKLVILDAKDPPQPNQVKLVNEANSVKVSWFYEGEDVSNFKIYRSTSGNTDVSDYLGSSGTMAFSDKAVQNKIGYYYRVSAVDEAGNEGPMSEEVFLMVTYENQSGIGIDSETAAKINSKINVLEAALRTLQAAKNALSEQTEPAARLVMENRGVVSDLDARIEALRLQIGEAKSLLQQELSVQDVNSRLASLQISQLPVVSEVRVRNKLSLEQSFNEYDAKTAAEEYLRSKQLTAFQKAKYLEQIVQLQQSMRVTQEIVELEILSDGGGVEYATVVTKKIASPVDVNDILIQELTPSGVVKYSDLEFVTDPVDLNSAGPIWRYVSIKDAGLVYSIDRLEGPEVLSQLKTVGLMEIEVFLNGLAASNETGDQITGAVVGSSLSFESLAYVIAALVIAGLLLVYYLMISKEKVPQLDRVVGTLAVQCRKAMERDDWETVRSLYSAAMDRYAQLAPDQQAVALECINPLYEEIVQKASEKA